MPALNQCAWGEAIWNQPAAPRNTLLATYQCPSDPTGDQDHWSAEKGDYVVNIGNTVNTQDIFGAGSGDYGGAKHLDPPMRVLFPYNAAGLKKSSTLIGITDGTSNTLVLSELLKATHAQDIRGATIWGWSSHFTTWFLPNDPQKDVINTGDGQCVALLAGVPDCVSSGDPTRIAARSKHTGGVNVGMGDGGCGS
jgi:hypothetical protein